jgi:hypothetical protein
MSAIRRPALLVAALALAGSALTACGTGPSQVNSALIIGDRVVTVDSVQDRLDTALRNEPATKELAKNRKLDLVSRAIVTQLVRQELLNEAARREGINVSEQDIADFIAGAAQSEEPLQRSVDAAFSPQERARTRLLAIALGRKYVDKLQITFDGVQLGAADGRRKAEEIAKKVAAQPDQAKAAFSSVATEPGQQIENERLSAVRGFSLAAENQILVTPMFGVPANTVVAFPLAGGQEGGGTWLVVLVKERTTSGTPSQQEAATVSQVAPQWNELIGFQMISSLSDELGIRISPRYGVWDKTDASLAASEAETKGIVLPAASKKS